MPFSMILAHSFSFRKELSDRLDPESVLIYQSGYLGDGPGDERKPEFHQSEMSFVYVKA